MEFTLKPDQSCALFLGEPRHGDLGPHGDHSGNIRLGDLGKSGRLLLLLSFSGGLRLLEEGFLTGAERFRVLKQALRKKRRDLFVCSRKFFRNELYGVVLLVSIPQTHGGTGLIDHIDRFIRQISVIDIALGEIDSCMDSFVKDHNIVVLFVGAEDSFKDLFRLRGGRLLDLDRLETPLQGGVFLHIFVILIERRGADQLDLTPCQGRL